MARTIADKIKDANRAGKDAEFTVNGVTYQFNPEGLLDYVNAEATGITPGAAVADATDGTDVVTQFNALLASLRAAGFIEESE